MSDYWHAVWGRGVEYGVALRKITASRLGLADVPLPAESIPAIARGDRPGSIAALLAFDLGKPTVAVPSWGEQWGVCADMLAMPFATLRYGVQEYINLRELHLREWYAKSIVKMGQMRRPLLYVTALGLTVGVPWYLYRYLTHYNVSDVWDHMVNTDERLGTGQVIDPNGILVPRPMDDEFNQAVTDYWDRWTWRGELMRFLERIGVSPVLTQRMRRRAERAAARRRTDNQLLRYRDKIMLVRAEVYATLGKESIRDDTPTARLAVARVVEEKMNMMTIDILTRENIREACVNVCFIDTVFDRSGQAILLGPPRRPI
jgi:hypothetical protein